MKTREMAKIMFFCGVVFGVSIACGSIASATDTPIPLPTSTDVVGAEYTQAIETYISGEKTEAALYTPTPKVLTATPLPTVIPTVATPPPTPTLTSLPLTGGTLLWVDDFESLDGWFTNETNDYTLEFSEGGYRMKVDMITGSAPVYSIRDFVYSDIRISIDLMRYEGPDGSYFGVVCRFTDPRNYYRFVLDPDGYYEIAKKVNGEFTTLGSGSERGLFLVGEEKNTIQGECYSGTLTLTINGKQMLQVSDGDLISGKVGIIGGANLEAGADLLFDNFRLFQP